MSAAIAVSFVVRPANADTPDPWDGNWHGSITPYAWLPGVKATTRFSLPSGSQVVTKSNKDILNNLSGAFMLEGILRKGRWGLYGDVDWVDFTNQKGRITSIGGDRIGAGADLNTRWGLKGGMVTLAGLYTIGHSSQGYVDLLLGMRYLWTKGNLNWNFGLTGNGGRVDIQDSGHLHNQMHVTDAIIGVRGHWTPFPDRHWYMPYYIDVGTGDSDSTYQLTAGVGYAFHWGDIALVYRQIKYRQDDNSKFLRDIELDGPAINFTWNF
ncbi:hypothetical protein [Dyella japonica]|uniref:Outer membrane protein beta-barrel domain-containing protein n=1 Tax=Dyella japonica TaxID=231455 RepID=A0ABV2K2D7_9GAMM